MTGGRLFVAWSVFVLVVMLCARFLPHPSAVLVADDWPNLARAEAYPDARTAARVGLTDPNRPLSMAALDAVFHTFGADARPFTRISIAANALLVLLVMGLARAATGSVRASVVAGLFFAVCPNLVETTHWSTQIVNELACALVGYLASAWCFARFAESPRAGWLIGSVVAYAVALFSYEAGLFLPAAYLLLLPPPRVSMRAVLRLAPFGAVAALYAAWRVTNAFGMNTSWFYPAHMQAGVSAYALVWNAWQIAHWWAGEHLIEALLAGWSGFMQLSPWTRRILLLFNALLTVAAAVAVARMREPESRETPRRLGLGFASVWFAAACAPLLISYTAPRLNVLPAAGIAIALGALAARARTGAWIALAAVPFFISLGALQGTTEQYRQAGEFNRRVYAHLEQTRGAWRDKIAIVFDTSGIRERQARRLIGPAGDHERTWAQYGNALLFRGFVPRGMLERIAGERPVRIDVVHDVENGARQSNGFWTWHARFDPSRSFVAPETAIYYVDLHSLVQ